MNAALDRAVWDAHGWPAEKPPADVEEDIILSRLPGYKTRGYTLNGSARLGDERLATLVLWKSDCYRDRY